VEQLYQSVQFGLIIYNRPKADLRPPNLTEQHGADTDNHRQADRSGHRRPPTPYTVRTGLTMAYTCCTSWPNGHYWYFGQVSRAAPTYSRLNVQTAP